MAGYIGTTPVPQATQHRESFTATGGQTSFATVGYTPQFIDVYLNGVKLAPADYTATNGSDVVLASGATASDILEIVAYTPFEIASQTFTGDTTANNFAVTGTFTSRGIDDNADAVAITIDSSENVGIGTISPEGQLHLYSSSVGAPSADADDFVIEKTGDTGLSILSTSTGRIYFGDTASNDQGSIRYVHSDNSMRFETDSAEAMRLDASGNLLVGTTDADIGSATSGSGFSYKASNGALQIARQASSATKPVLVLNTTGVDSSILDFRKDGSSVATIGVNSNDNIYFAGEAGNTAGIYLNNAALIPADTGGTPVDDHVNLGTASNRWSNLYLAGGVAFGDAGGSGTSTSNLLDSYEEGTWQPVAADNSSGGNTTTTGQGFYTKIGRLVIATCDITNINTTGLTLANTFNVQGLPFTNNGTVRSTATLQVNLINNGDGLIAHLAENQAAFSFKYNNDSKNNSAAGLLVSDIKDDQADMFGITLVYHTSS
jgi:hypothetical protein